MFVLMNRDVPVVRWHVVNAYIYWIKTILMSNLRPS